ncbi:MAG TPA: site-specific integrase [Sulfurimonas autotrophica]|nr:site-specific integrase [Sulfurimonas autotrophica]
MLNNTPVYRLYEKNNNVYLDYRKDGKRYRKSLGLDYNQKNLKAIHRNIDRVLLNFTDKIKSEKKLTTKFVSFGLNAIESTSINRNERTQSDYISKFNRLILPSFKDYSIDEIKVFHIENWQKAMLKNYSTTTVKRCKSILSLIFNNAIANELIQINPAQYAQKFRVDHKRQEPYTVQEMEMILKYSTGWFNVFLYLAFTTGMRPGELIGLKWTDIDFKRCVINLKRSISKGVISKNTFTKNHNRLVIVPRIVISMIEKFKHSNEYIFVNKYNQPFYESKTITKVYLEPFLKEIGVKYKTLKATRHTYISIMRNGGVSQEFILDIVGHSKEVSNKHYYTNSLTNAKTDAINNVFDTIFSKKEALLSHQTRKQG